MDHDLRLKMNTYSRRKFIQTVGLTASGSLMMSPRLFAGSHGRSSDWYLPDEAAPHSRTWMAFGAREDIWGRRLLPEVQRNLALIANTISQYEPVRMLVRPDEMELAHELIEDRIDLIPAEMDDLWMRDTGPTFVLNRDGGKAAVDFNFNGWGEKQEHQLDRHVAALIAKNAGVKRLTTDLVMEGGCFEVDGEGTAIMTESCVLNSNRNPELSKAIFEDLIMPLLGLRKIIWLPGIKGRDITDGHTDFYARFARPGVVIAGYDPDPDSFDHEITKLHLAILNKATDAKGNPLEVIVLEGPTTIREDYETKDFAAGYIGYYVCNGAVILQGFGDRSADRVARSAVTKAFPHREIVQINIDGIAAGGGSIHCATQQEPRAS